MIKQQFIPLSATGRRPGIAMKPEYITMQVRMGRITVEQVPEKYKEEVLKLLEKGVD